MAGKQNKIDNRQEFKDRLKSITFMLNRGDKLIKSEIGSINSEYDLLNNVKVEKKGSEIKEAIDRLVDTLQTRKENSKILMITLAKEINDPPKDSCRDNYMIREYPNVFDYTPMRYNYNQIYSENGGFINGEDGKKMQRYNAETHNYIENCIYKAKLKKASEYIKENKNYTVTPTFALKLGL